MLEALDHRFLNKEVPEFFTSIPTTENLAIAIWQRLSPKLKAVNCIGSGCTNRPTFSSISTGKHEGLPDAAVHVFCFPPAA